MKNIPLTHFLVFYSVMFISQAFAGTQPSPRDSVFMNARFCTELVRAVKAAKPVAYADLEKSMEGQFDAVLNPNIGMGLWAFQTHLNIAAQKSDFGSPDLEALASNFGLRRNEVIPIASYLAKLIASAPDRARVSQAILNYASEIKSGKACISCNGKGKSVCRECRGTLQGRRDFALATGAIRADPKVGGNFTRWSQRSADNRDSHNNAVGRSRVNTDDSDANGLADRD